MSINKLLTRYAECTWRIGVCFAASLITATALAQPLHAATPKPAHSPGILEKAYWMALGARLTERALNVTLQVCGVVAAYLLVRALLNRVVDGVTAGIVAREERLGVTQERAGRLKTLSGLLKSMVGYVMFFVFGVLIFKAIGFDIMPFITTAGVIGLAIGFGAQKLVKDVISGFFIIVDNMFVVGDMITVGAVTGEVQEMGMRVTRMLDPSGRVVTISNGDIGTVTNLSRNPVEDFIEIAVAPAFDMKTTTTAINSAGQDMYVANRQHLKAAPKLIGVTAFSAASVTLRIAVVSDPKELSQEQMRVREQMRSALAKAGIAPA